ncbi:MAG: flavin reductase family protein [Ruminococcus sp.]|jgi:flavin reductase (DIM6/NTAB) family NADH-FMN oxidoreductase RutF|nr:flavin reductase family protein [Ruminococcus sp.]
MSFVKTSTDELNVNPFELIGKDWFLITAGDSAENYNTMTASWGAMGEMWGKHMFLCAIRPNRHTYGFVENSEYFTVSCFDPEKYRQMLSFCGSRSGRDYDKAKETGITPVKIEQSVAFEEADMILVCRKMYAQDMDESCFIDKDALKFYEKDPLHKMYISEIVSVYKSDKK